MQVFVPKSGRSKKSAMMAPLAAACAMGLMVSVAVEPAEARKGDSFKSTTTGTIKPPPSRIVRDHRGQPQPQPRVKCFPPACRPTYDHKGWGGSSKVRDHRSGACTGKGCK